MLQACGFEVIEQTPLKNDRMMRLVTKKTALRRRFDFIEMMPLLGLLHSEANQGLGIIEGVELETLLHTMNQRIEALYDREHTLGHAFLMKLHSLADLRHAFKNKILPTLTRRTILKSFSVKIWMT